MKRIVLFGTVMIFGLLACKKNNAASPVPSVLIGKWQQTTSIDTFFNAGKIIGMSSGPAVNILEFTSDSAGTTTLYGSSFKYNAAKRLLIFSGMPSYIEPFNVLITDETHLSLHRRYSTGNLEISENYTFQKE